VTYRAAILALLLAAGPASAQVADGRYPAVLACDAAAGRGPVRVQAEVTIAAGRASYDVGLAGGRETGAGTLSGRTLSLSGKGAGYGARYSGEVTGKGGLLTGAHTGPGFRRACQLVLGDG
jgi:hypothetical protein